MKSFSFIIHVLVSESFLGLVRLGHLAGMLILIKVNTSRGLKNKEKKIIDVICFKLFIYVFMESGSVY